MTNKQTIIDDLKEMIYKLQIECAEKTDNILTLGEQLKSAEKTIEILEAKIGGYEYAISDIVKEYQGKLDGKEQEYEELKDKLQKYIDREQWEIELNKKRADSFKEMRRILYGKFDGSSLIDYKNKRGGK